VRETPLNGRAWGWAAGLDRGGEWFLYGVVARFH